MNFELCIDFHTHTVPASPDVVALVDGLHTWGVHPWCADAEAAEPLLADKLAIGECGLDAMRGPSLEVQEEVFRWQISLSEQHGLPMVIHCVKAFDRLLAIHRELRPRQPWVFHGFRGKPQQLRSLLDAGFYVSFGVHYNADSLRLCPADRLLLETDTDPLPIADHYAQVAAQRVIPLPQLISQMSQNYRALVSKVHSS